MTKRKVVLFGIEDTASLAHYYLTKDSDYEVVAFTLTTEYIKQEQASHTSLGKDYPVVAYESLTKEYHPSEFLLFSPMTGAKMNVSRQTIFETGKRMGYEHVTYVSSKASTFDNSIGENCFILEDNTIQPFVSIGNNVVMWSGNHIGHHSKINDNVFFTSHVVLSGHCHVKNNCWFGVNSTIRNALTLEEKTLVAMGACVTKSTDRNGVYVGIPAKKISDSSIDFMV